MDNYNYDIYFNKNYHDDVYNNGNYFDAIYLGNKLWWKKSKKEIRLQYIESIFIHDGMIYAGAVCNVYEDNKGISSMFICTIEGNTIYPIIDIKEKYLRGAGSNGFLLYSVGQHYYVNKNSDVNAEPIPVEEFVPDFPCSYIYDKKAERFTDGTYYYTRKTVTENSVNIHVVSKYDNKTGELIDSVSLRNEYFLLNLTEIWSGGNLNENIFYLNNGNVFLAGRSASSDAFFKFGELSPTVVLESPSSIGSGTPISTVIDKSYNARYFVTPEKTYTLGTLYDNNEKKYKRCVYSFDGSIIELVSTYSVNDVSYILNISVLGDIIALSKNYIREAKTENDFLQICLIKNGVAKVINIAPIKNIFSFCGFWENGNYISCFIHFRFMYNDIFGLKVMNINKNTLEIEGYDDMTLDSQYIE